MTGIRGRLPGSKTVTTPDAGTMAAKAHGGAVINIRVWRDSTQEWEDWPLENLAPTRGWFRRLLSKLWAFLKNMEIW